MAATWRRLIFHACCPPPLSEVTGSATGVTGGCPQSLFNRVDMTRVNAGNTGAPQDFKNYFRQLGMHLCTSAFMHVHCLSFKRSNEEWNLASMLVMAAQVNDSEVESIKSQETNRLLCFHIHKMAIRGNIQHISSRSILLFTYLTSCEKSRPFTTPLWSVTLRKPHSKVFKTTALLNDW